MQMLQTKNVSKSTTKQSKRNQSSFFFSAFSLIIVSALLLNACSTPINYTPRVENWYFKVLLPEGWNGMYLSDNQTIFPSIIAGKGENNYAIFSVANYKAQGIPLGTMMKATLGEMNLASMYGKSVHDISFQGYPAQMIRANLQGDQVMMIGFFGPTGLFSYIWVKNLTDEELDQLLQGVTLIDTIKPEYVDFDVVWRAYIENKEKITPDQQIIPGVMFQGLTYNASDKTLNMTVWFEGSNMAVRSYFNSGLEGSFIQGLKDKYVIIPIANNYGITLNLDVLDQAGYIAYRTVVR